MNKNTIARMIRFAMARLTGDSAWCVAGSLGSALAHLELGDWRAAAFNYSQARKLMIYKLKKGEFKKGEFHP